MTLEGRITGSNFWSLRMIRFFPQQSVEKWLSRRLLASTVRLDGHKDCIDFSQLPRVVQAKHPPAIGLTIHVQDAKVRRMRFPIGFGVSLAPYLEGAGISYPRLVIKVESVKNERFVLRIEDPPERLARSASAIHIKHIGDIEFARAHQFPDIAIGAKILFIVIEAAALILIGRGQFAQLRFERRGPQKCLAMFVPEIREFHLKVWYCFSVSPN